MREDEITTLTLADEAATAHLAATLCAALLAHAPALRETGFNLRLEGNLGAGKTTFTRALLRAAGFAGITTSLTASRCTTLISTGLKTRRNLTMRVSGIFSVPATSAYPNGVKKQNRYCPRRTL